MRRSAEAAIAHEIIAHPCFERASRIAIYRAFDGEVALDAVERAAAQAGKSVVFACVVERDSALAFVAPATWRRRRNGLPVPVGPSVVLDRDDLVLVPGVVFDHAGGRLGFGGGYYDRTLARLPATAVGVCFECQCIDRLPRAPWDEPVAALITERGTREFDIEECRD